MKVCTIGFFDGCCSMSQNTVASHTTIIVHHLDNNFNHQEDPLHQAAMGTKGSSTDRRLYPATVYQACDGQYTKGRAYYRDRLEKSPHHQVVEKEHSVQLILDREAEDFSDMILKNGSIIPPDEILDSAKPSRIAIPVKFRDEFPLDKPLPPAELLKVLHYYTAKKFSQEPRLTRRFDESALLALGMLVEQWVDEVVDEKASKYFSAFDKTEVDSEISSAEDESSQEVIDVNDEEEMGASSDDDDSD